ncbi:hypothetical protein ACQJBY_061521 [Aegilops geniculata]
MSVSDTNLNNGEKPISNTTDAELAEKHGHMKLVCSQTRFGKTMKLLSEDHKKYIISETSLGGLTQMHEVTLRRIMLVRLAKSIDMDTKTITIGKTPIRITKEDVQGIFGIPIEGEDIEPHLENQTDTELFTAYANNGQILISNLETAIRASKAPDGDFLRRFILYAIATVLAPTTQHYVDSKYLNLVTDLENLRKFNWGCFTLNHFFKSVHKFRNRDHINLQGNLILLQHWYWEHVRSGRLMYASRPPPLIARWDEMMATIRSDAYEKGGLHNGLIEMVVEVMNARIADHEKKVGRKLMEIEHIFDVKYQTLGEDLIDMKTKTGTNPRLSKAEDEIKDLRRELHDLKYEFTRNRQSVSQKGGVQVINMGQHVNI